MFGLAQPAAGLALAPLAVVAKLIDERWRQSGVS
jgi:hypothetical protein